MSCEAYHIFFQTLSNELRINIVTALRRKEMSVGELSQKLGVEQSKISHALASLRCCSVVVSRQEGKRRIYSLNKETLVPILEIIDKHEKKFCAGCMYSQKKQMKIRQQCERL